MSNEHEHCVAQPYEDTPVKVFGKLRYHLFICSDANDFCGCEANGGGALLAAVRQELAKRKLLAQVKMTLMHCRQQGAGGPVMVLHPDGIWYDGLKAENAAEFVESQIIRGEPVERFLMKQPPKPVTAVPAHIVESADCCGEKRTPEERAAAAG
jgi:(2Fe-2S) ferredoxin